MPNPNPMPNLYDVDGSSYVGTGLDAAPSGYGSEYDRLFQANPYRNLQYKESLWQKLVSALGFRTDADRWREDAQVNSAEYDAGIFSMMQQNQFNSPESQAARMRQAGLNPDLLGLGDVASAASPAEDPNGMSPNVGNEEFSDFGNTVVSVFSRAMTIFKDFKSLEQMNTIIDSQNTDNAVKMIGAIDSFIESSLTDSDFVSRQTFVDKINALSDSVNDDELLPFEQSRVSDLGLSKRQRKQYYSLMRDRLLSISTDKKAYDLFKSRIDAMTGSKESQSNPFYFDGQDSESAVDILVKGLSKAHQRSLKYIADADAARAAVQNQEAQTLEEMQAGVSSARSQVTEYNSKKAVSQWNAECARIKKDMLRDLERSALRGDWLAKAMLMSWSLDDIARMNVGLNAGANLGLNLGLGANLSNSVSTIFKP